MQCPECDFELDQSARGCSCGWRKEKEEFALAPGGGSFPPGVLDFKTFDEQFDALKMDYPSQARDMTHSVKKWWWNALKNTTTTDFVNGIIAARIKSPARLPNLPIVEACVREEGADRARSNHGYVKRQGMTYEPKDIKDPVQKQIAANIFGVLQSGDISVKKWKALAKKYDFVPNKSKPGETFGDFFMDQAVTLSRYKLKRRSERKARKVAEAGRATRPSDSLYDFEKRGIWN